MIAYIIKSCASLLVFFGIYWFFLRREKIFEFNRFFLLIALVISLILPLISIPVHINAAPLHTYTQIFIPEVSESYSPVTNDFSPLFKSRKSGISSLMSVIYATGVILFLLRFLININSILIQIKKSDRIRFKKYSIVLINAKKNPYCFFRYVFLNKDDYLVGRIENDILRHELKHIEQLHTIDIILLELVKILSWYNPVCLLYDKAIRINHEYMADNAVIAGNKDIKGYIEKLVNFVPVPRAEQVSTGYSDSNVKSRILMMAKTASGKNGIRLTLVTISIFVFFILMSFKMISDEKPLAHNETGIIVNFLTTDSIQDNIRKRKINFSSESEKQSLLITDGKNRSDEAKDSPATVSYGAIDEKGVIINGNTVEQSKGNVEKSAQTTVQDKDSEAVIATASSNVLYRGIANKLEIAVPGIPSDRVTASISIGSIYRTNGGWEAVINDRMINECMIAVLINKKVISQKKFIVKDMPNPIAVLVSNRYVDYRSGHAYKQIVPSYIRVETGYADTTIRFSVTSFTFLTKSKTGDIEIPASGNALTVKMKSIISDLKKGTDIIFKDIKAQGPDGPILNLNPIIIKMD